MTYSCESSCFTVAKSVPRQPRKPFLALRRREKLVQRSAERIESLRLAVYRFHVADSLVQRLVKRYGNLLLREASSASAFQEVEVG